MPRPPSFSAILRVTPPPTSLAYTSPIYRKLKATADISSFQALLLTPRSSNTSPQQDVASESQLFRAIFASEPDLRRALTTGSFTVDVDHDLSRPEGLDPFNVFGLAARNRPSPMSFRCELRREEVPAAEANGIDTAREQTQLVKTQTGLLYNSLLDAGVPMGQLEGLSTIIEFVTDEEENAEAKVMPLSLMDMYREAVRRRNTQEQSGARSVGGLQGDKKVPIRYYPVTPMGRRR